MKQPDELKPADCPLVSVEWEDITELANWNEDDGPFQPTSIKSVGWLIEENSKWMTIARDYDHTNDKWSSVVIIPKMPPVVMIHAGAPKIVGAGVPDTVFDDVHEELVERPLPPEDEHSRKMSPISRPFPGFSRDEMIAKGWVLCTDGTWAAPMVPVSDPDPYPDPPAPDTGSWPVWTNQNPWPSSTTNTRVPWPESTTDGTIPGQP